MNIDTVPTADPSRSARRLACLAAILSIMVAGDATVSLAQDPSATPVGSAAQMSPSASPSGLTDASPAGTTRIRNVALGTGTYPAYSLDIPAGWSVDGPFTVKSVDGPQVMGISVWDVGDVPGDPCHWQTSVQHPGPSVDDLVTALQAQVSRQATVPVDVTLSGYSGRYLEWSVPADIVVTGEADFQGCDIEPTDGHQDFVSWWGNGTGERYQQVAGQVDRLWILDVDGQRLLVDATYSPDATAADIAEQLLIVQSLRFEEP